jgi:hypothetical protein
MSAAFDFALGLAGVLLKSLSSISDTESLGWFFFVASGAFLTGAFLAAGAYRFSSDVWLCN